MEEEPGGLGKALEEVLWEEVVGQVTQERHDGEGALTEDEVRFARTRARELVEGVRSRASATCSFSPRRWASRSPGSSLPR